MNVTTTTPAHQRRAAMQRYFASCQQRVHGLRHGHEIEVWRIEGRIVALSCVCGRVFWATVSEQSIIDLRQAQATWGTTTRGHAAK